MALAMPASCSSLPQLTARFSVHDCCSISASFCYVCIDGVFNHGIWRAGVHHWQRIGICFGSFDRVVGVGICVFVVVLMVFSVTTLVSSASTAHFPYVGPTVLFVWSSALFVIGLMVLSTTTLVPSASIHFWPDANLMALFVQVSASLVVALMLLTTYLLFVLFLNQCFQFCWWHC